MRKFMFFLAALALMGVVAWAIQYGKRVDTPAGHHQGATSGVGKPIPFILDSKAQLWTHDAPVEVLLTGTQKTKVWDGTNTAAVLATILSLKVDLSSVAGVVTNVNGGNRDTGTQTVTLADDDPAVADLAAMELLLAGTQKAKIWDGTNTASVLATILSLKVDLSSVAGVVTNVNGGNRDTGTQTVTLADDDPAVADLAAIETAVLHNTRGVAVVTVTKNTWTALSGIGTHRTLQIVCRNSTDAATATLNIWGSDDGGTTFYPLVRADTLAKAKDVAIDVGTDFNPTEGAGVANVDTVVVMAGPSTHIYIHEEGGAGGTFAYEVGGL